MAARELGAGGYRVVLLEGANRTGGRIHTIEAPGFEQPVEMGAEFMHGRLPLTMELLEEAGTEYEKTSGRMVQMRKGEWKQQDDFTIDWDLLLQRLYELKEDVPLAVFLGQYFGGEEYAALRSSVRRFAEGFDVANINDVSTFALREEWSHEEDGQFRITGGYGQLIHYLERQCRDKGVVLHTSCIVKKINWSAGAVQAVCADGRVFEAGKLLITVPAGVLQAGADTKAGIAFSPAVEAYTAAIRQIGFGTVTKILLQFKTAFWNSYAKNIGFVLGEATIPTWWTQDATSCLLTGWLAGPAAAVLKGADEATLLQAAIASLAVIFNKTEGELRGLLVAGRVADWEQDPFSMGAYSYDTIHTAAARRLLLEPVANTLFWAGEALYEGTSPGTVEAAFASGKTAAERLMS
jgi:monoamine oxidase